MKKHFNLYYIFLEDKLRNPMPEDRRKAIRQILENFFRAIRAPSNGHDRLREKNT